jgi:PleD family two-component response regulator
VLEVTDRHHRKAYIPVTMRDSSPGTERLSFPHARPPVVLIINDQEWSTRSLESILSPQGYAVLRAYTGALGLERAGAARPDVILIGASLPDMDGLEVTRRLRADARIPASTPIVLTTTVRPSRQERLDALREGAWDYLGHPLDAEELIYKFDAYVRGKHDADRARTEGLIDALTGLYSTKGLARRAHEIGSQASREGGPLACIVLSAEASGAAGGLGVERAVRALAELLHRAARASDAVGRIGEAEFAIFAPGADTEGAARLAQRFVGAAQGLEEDNGTRLVSGYHAVPDFRQSGLQPDDLLARATAAHKAARHPPLEQALH